MRRATGFRALAPAKVNLFLHVGAPEPSGYHPVSSLVVFADVGDLLTIEPAPDFGLEISGPFADALDGEGDNLVTRAARGFAAAAGLGAVPARLTLDKRLPIASGVGGGSADAGAALRLLQRALATTPLGAPALEAVAAGLGADGPMCLHARPALATGYGERLAPAPAMPPLDAVLVNPRAPSPTGPVYRAYDEAVAPEGAAPPVLPARFERLEAVIAMLNGTRNDLEAPARRLTPAIGEVLAALEAAPETLFARMSGSGATCFALCASADHAAALAQRLAAHQPGWWVQPCRLGGPWAGAEPSLG